jgi:hypothetical protein
MKMEGNYLSGVILFCYMYHLSFSIASSVYIVTHMTIARQRLGKQIPGVTPQQ